MPGIEKPFGLYVVTLADFAAFGVLQFFKTIADAQKSEKPCGDWAETGGI
jgi:hypothetical protein